MLALGYLGESEAALRKKVSNVTQAAAAAKGYAGERGACKVERKRGGV